VRKGKWKFLCEFDGSIPELYDLSNDPGETTNIADKQPGMVTVLSKTLRSWNASMPPDRGAELARNPPKKKKKPKK
jgi:uncharacterized sulfatase